MHRMRKREGPRDHHAEKRETFQGENSLREMHWSWVRGKDGYAILRGA